ncbi:MAG: hypothetical protein HKN79_00030 [Flavobacteriales bacterium]|nr:hypothetical protein [Flavobacteriales bacterium]
MHRFLRKRFVAWGDDWNYLRFNEVEELLSSFSEVSYQTVGFFGAFGRNETQRRFLGRIDRALDRFIPRSMRYIVFVKARK